MGQSYNPFSLAGKTILVTGASSGIGRATAIECAKMGATVILSAIPEESDMLQDVLEALEGNGHAIVLADLKSEDEIRALATHVGMLDGVVFAAGTLSVKPLAYYSMKSIQDAFSVNTFACMSLTKELVKAKMLKENSSLVFISSVASGSVTAKALGLYSASKAALDSFSRQCAVELADRNIRSNTINPGMVRTDLTANNTIYSIEDVLATSSEKLSLFKRFGLPEEISWCAVYLLSDASAFVTGASFVIDGGLHLI